MIIEFESKYENEVKKLLIDLQKYVVEIDKYKLNIIKDNYKELYFDNMLNEVINNEGKIYLNVVDNRVIGFIAGYVEKYSDLDKCMYKCPKKGIVAELIVDKNARSNGNGKELLECLEDYFYSINCEYVQIDVFAYNDSALKFYKKRDYEERMVTLFKKIK